MEVIILDIGGKFAHFRKYYANNTAFSYSLPPRTTVMGMLAGLLGLPKDSYYEAMASENLRIGMAIQSNIKKSFHRLNFLKIANANDLRGKSGRVQTPFEVVSGQDFAHDLVQYRLFVSYRAEGKALFEQLKEALTLGNFKYNLSLGTANFSGTLERVLLVEAKTMVSEETIAMHSAVVSDGVTLGNFAYFGESFNIGEETMPLDFVANNNREVAAMRQVLYNQQKKPLWVKTKRPFFQAIIAEQSINFQFIE